VPFDVIEPITAGTQPITFSKTTQKFKTSLLLRLLRGRLDARSLGTDALALLTSLPSSNVADLKPATHMYTLYDLMTLYCAVDALDEHSSRASFFLFVTCEL
jgi:hypothetical protein